MLLMSVMLPVDIMLRMDVMSRVDDYEVVRALWSYPFAQTHFNQVLLFTTQLPSLFYDYE